LVTILARSNAVHHTELGSHVTLSAQPVADFVWRNGGAVTHAVAQRLNALVSAQAAVLSYADTARAVGWISLLLAPLALILRRPKAAGIPVTE
jgi:DHA2 family multidrug resistance protein